MDRSRTGKATKPGRSTASPTGLSPSGARETAPSRHFPHLLGNRAFGRWIQAKLTVGAPHDRYEQEADQVAEEVTRATGTMSPPTIQRKCKECEEDLRRQPAAGTAPDAVSPSTEAAVRGLHSGGEPLSPAIRTRFEPRFGHDFSQVRIHTGPNAERSASEINALAYTVGSDIAFAPGRYAPDTHAGQRLLAHELAHVVQQGHAGPSSQSVIRRQAAPDTEGTSVAPASLIVNDDAQQIGPGQMRKSEFLSSLKSQVCRESEEAMKGTGRTTEGCPYVEKWFGYYADKDGAYIERSLKKYAPEARNASSASEYMPLVAARVRRSVEVWAQTGEITGVPDELAGAVMGGGILGVIGSVVSGIGSAIGSVVSGIGSVLSGIGRLLFKGRDGNVANQRDAGAVAGALGNGRSLDAPVRQRMESAFGHDFSQVRIHTDSQAAGLSAGMDARAFTIGQQVAFGSGEYRPGTMVGDALIAHELAHVAQQSGPGNTGSLFQKGEDTTSILEEDADRSAVRAVVSMWKGSGQFGAVTERAMPSLRSGLQLQRCSRHLVPGPNYEDCSPAQQKTVTDSYMLAKDWVAVVIPKLDGLLAGNDDPDTLNQLDNHFHIKNATQGRDDIAKVRKGFAKLQAAFAGPVPFKCEGGKPSDSREGGCLEGGVPLANVPAFPTLSFGWVGDIHFYPDFFVNSLVGDEVPGSDTQDEVKKKAFKERAAIILHEMAHKFLEVGDQEYYKGCGTRRYNALSTKQALDNADSYAQFAHYVQADK